ncbi:KCNKH protein, partial [Polyodon spathula]|nr:KCNKH protein [Polyodon spathula]
GYGDMTPTTTHGQLFCVLFALVGIPLNVVVLNKFGKFMLSIEQRITTSYLSYVLFLQKTARVLITGISFLIGMTLFIFIPAYGFHTFENWTYNESFYYTIITLSTIGFGDYVPGNDPDINYPLCYREVVAAWIFFGLAWLSLVINSFIEMLEKISKYFNQRQSGRVAAIIFYLSIGAAIFQVLEEPNWKSAFADYKSKKTQILKDYPCLKKQDLEKILEVRETFISELY